MATTSDTSPEHVDNKINDDKKKKEQEEEEEAAKKLQSTPADKIEENQGSKTTEKSDDLTKTGKIDTVSSVKSTNEDNKSDQTSPKANETSDTHAEKKNEEKTTVETTTTIDHQKDESGSALNAPAPTSDSNIKTKVVPSGPDESTSSGTSSSTKNDEDSKKQTTLTEAKSDFSIEKGDSQHLTDFQREKAKYFFKVNLDIENKEYVIWEEVEFYLLFHATAAGKEGSDESDLESRLSRATRAFWEHVHDQLPLPDGNREKLTLDQFLDTWASLIEYVLRTGQLPPMVQELVKLGFELYSTDDGDGKSKSVGHSAFEQLFQSMNLDRRYAIMAYKYLTENGTKPLDAETIDSIVKAVITSSDDEHDSHFLLPGFFITIAENKNRENKNKTSPSGSDNEQSKVSNKSSPRSTPPSTLPPSPPTIVEKPNIPPPQTQQPSSQSHHHHQQQQQQNSSSIPSTQSKQPSSLPASSQAQQTNGAASQLKQTRSPSASSQTQPTNDPSSSSSQTQPTNGPPPPSSQPKQAPTPQVQQTSGPYSAFSQPKQSPTPQVQQTSGPYSAFSHPQQPPNPQVQQPSGPYSAFSQPKQPVSPQIQQNNGHSSAFSRPQKPSGPPPSQKQPGPPINQQQNTQSFPKPQSTIIQQEDENIRSLLRYYHIDDGDVVEVAGGSVQRLIRVHPERPLPSSIQPNNQLQQKLQPVPTNVSSGPPSSVQQNGSNGAPNKSNNNGKPPPSQEKPAPPTETKPKVTLEERLSSGDAQKGPSVPLRQESKPETSSSAGARQVYPSLSEAQQEEQRKQAKLQTSPPAQPATSTDEKTTADSKTKEAPSTSKKDETKEASSASQEDQRKDFTDYDEEKIVAAVLKKLAPMIEKRVAAEVRRANSDDEEEEDDDDNFIPFPFMFGGGGGGAPFPFFATPHGGPPPQAFQQQGVPGQGPQQQQQQQQSNDPRVMEFEGFPGGGGQFIPPQLLMAMMSDLARGGVGGEIHGFPPNMQPPRGPGGVPIGVEGFMMFVDDDQMMGGPSDFPPRSGPRF